MNLLPRSPSYISSSHPDFGVTSAYIRVSPDMPIYVKPVRRVHGKARILALSNAASKHLRTGEGFAHREEVSGHEYASQDVFFGHNWLTNDIHYLDHPARNSYIEYKRENGMDMRLATWQGMGFDVNYATHAHLITSHLKTGVQHYQSYQVGDVVPFDFFIVNIFLIEHYQQTILAAGSDRFCTMKCPWVISSTDLIQIEKMNTNLF
ncbi:MAG: hypothetical protein Q8K61_08770 [Gallionella sp.]|nr:hypothetical protein [Gallionella sp.]